MKTQLIQLNYYYLYHFCPLDHLQLIFIDIYSIIVYRAMHEYSGTELI